LKPELIILEIVMLVLNGLDAGEKLKQKLPTKADISLANDTAQ
jgi:hypothetical protein